MPSSLHRGSSLRSVDSQPGQDIFSEDGDEDVGPSISARGYSPVLPHDSDSEMEDLPPFPIGSVSEYPTWSAEPNTVPPPQHRASIQRDYGFLPPPDNPPPSAGDRPAPLDIERLVSRLHALDSEHTLEGEDELLDPIEGGGEELEVVLTLRDEEREMDLVEGYIPDVPGGAVEPEPEDVEMEEEEWLAKRRSYLSLKSERSEQAEATVPSSPTGVKLVEDPMDEAILVHGGPFDLRRIRRYSAVSTGAYGPGLKLFRVLYDRTFGSGAKPPKARSKKDPPDEERRFSKHFEGRRSSSVSFAPSGTATPRAGDSLHPDEHQILANHAGTRLSAIIHSSFMDEQPARGLGLGIGQMLGAFGPEMAMPNGHGAVPPMRSSHSEPGENAGAPPASPDGDAHPAPPLPSESWNHPTFYILADRPAHSIVVVLRGTATVSEVMVDMTCEYEEFSLDPSWADAERELLGRAGGAPAPFLVHGGILRAAHHLAGRGSRFLRHLARALEENPGFTLTLVGHSLGAGLASLLGCMWVERGKWMTRRGIGLPEGRRVKVFAYGGSLRRFLASPR
ncbi:hypothetical protein DFJ74DRAFT_697483 [Hyaloraphidium curvatum]|nr:hypothetical protein DFJ74DRAFT_697483 [Hyaloraphidium curvatum]